eukprot:1072666-Pyramimonas_sp.AAC.1
MVYDKFCDAVPWDRLSTYQRRAEHKRLMREAARHVRNRLIKLGDASVDAQLVVYRSISRAVWRNDIRLARKLLASSPIALRHLSVAGLHVQLQGASEFDADFLLAQNAYADQ